jgi:FMN-dependent NADH-azoreductase
MEVVMSHLLYIKASPRSDRSYAIGVADAFLDAYERSHPDDQITSLDVFYDDLPEFDFEVVSAKYKILNGRPLEKRDEKVWGRVVETINDFKAADKYIVATPMWNFSIPYRLKHYIDLLVQPGLTFAARPDGTYDGLVKGKPLLLVCAQGGSYPSETPDEAYDFQRRYLERVFGFIGFENIQSIVVHSTLMGPEAAAKSKAAAIDRAREIAPGF